MASFLCFLLQAPCCGVIYPKFCIFRDLSEQNDLEGAILECLLSSSNEVKSAASFALGKLRGNTMLRFVGTTTILDLGL